MKISRRDPTQIIQLAFDECSGAFRTVDKSNNKLLTVTLFLSGLLNCLLTVAYILKR